MAGALGDIGRGPGWLSARLHVIAAALLLCGLGWGCGGKPPEMPAVEWRLEQRQSKAGPHEGLWVFASVKDSEGLEDIDALYVVNDAAGLDWKLTNANWTKRVEGADTWIGAAGLAMNDYGPIPRGDYRAVSVTAAGEQAEKSFRVDGDFPSLPPPAIVVSKTAISLRSSWPETLLLGFDGTGTLIGSSAWTGSPENLAEFFGSDIAARISGLQAYGYEPNRHMGSYSERMAVR